MSLLAAGGLALLHIIQTVWTCLISLLYYPFVPNPRPLVASRLKLPSKLGLILADTHENPSEEEIRNVINNVVLTVKWCKEAGIPNLSVYDRYGTGSKYSKRIKTALNHEAFKVTESRSLSTRGRRAPSTTLTINYTSDMSSSQKLISNKHSSVKGVDIDQQDRPYSYHQLTLSLLSYESSKPCMASLARSFTSEKNTEISVSKIDKTIYDTLNLQAPDLTIVHSIIRSPLRAPGLELYGFPPWLLKLTEIYYDDRPSLLRAWRSRTSKQRIVAISEENFRRALDSYDSAEMRLGK
ncbi:hypothetical protein PNOK_0190200 [Pyrrhoderma noxium]|uniref:ditrans,polycis-polyprenyl diphosphate synthase [(2E,6E)-farnesyldiphosphate specific] n=1 Tax=Pyrrhoderma noxium TaxID=2282107 RepID=A0A286UR45_9AGAM|nr:hypothetical protein PNOK_0190200 [Pyrrhoderma noxium]